MSFKVPPSCNSYTWPQRDSNPKNFSPVDRHRIELAILVASLSRTATTAGRWRSDRFLRIARCIGDLRIVGNVQLENGRWATNENQRLAGPETHSIGLLS
ncbi:MAG: hypothetical protein VX832_06650, partial [Actinomycetota bacterium]|nr:hypothetical protein [Actinomycetota bacterium]